MRQSKIQNIGDSVLVPEVDVIDDPSEGIDMAQPLTNLHTLPDEFIDEMVIETAEEIIEVDGSRNFVTDEYQDMMAPNPNVSDTELVGQTKRQ